MKKLYFATIILLLVVSFSFAEIPFTPIYWIRGTVRDAPEGTANGRKIYFANNKAWDIIGPTGNSGKPNQFLINAGLAGVPLEPGKRYPLFTERADGLGVGPVEVEISGTGIEELDFLTLTPGGGVVDIRAFAVQAEPQPQIKIWFNGRVYQRALVEKGREFYIPKKPKVKMEVTIEKPYVLSNNTSNYSFSVDRKFYSFTSSKIEGNKAVFETTLSDELSPGKYNFTFSAQSSGALAPASTVSETAVVTVAGGPLRLLDTPLTFPSPFNPEKDREVTFQYTLSDSANIDIFIFNIAGEVVRKISIQAGVEGGMGQLNKVKWDGRTDQGSIVSSGIYIGNIVARDENKVLGKFKLTVYR